MSFTFFFISFAFWFCCCFVLCLLLALFIGIFLPVSKTLLLLIYQNTTRRQILVSFSTLSYLAFCHQSFEIVVCALFVTLSPFDSPTTLYCFIFVFSCLQQVCNNRWKHWNKLTEDIYHKMQTIISNIKIILDFFFSPFFTHIETFENHFCEREK